MTSKTENRFSPEVCARAVRTVLDHEEDHSSRWAIVVSIAVKIGCAAWTLNERVKKVEVNSGTCAGRPSDGADRMKALERGNRELRQANELLRKASAYLAMAELDRRARRWCRSSLRIARCMGSRRSAGFGRSPLHLPCSHRPQG